VVVVVAVQSLVVFLLYHQFGSPNVCLFPFNFTLSISQAVFVAPNFVSRIPD
jgi:hypothetical protein